MRFFMKQRRRDKQRRPLSIERLDARQVLSATMFAAASDNSEHVYHEVAMSNDSLEAVVTADPVSRATANSQNRLDGFEGSSFRIPDPPFASPFQGEASNEKSSLKRTVGFFDTIDSHSSNVLIASLDPQRPLDHFAALSNMPMQGWGKNGLSDISSGFVAPVGRSPVPHLDNLTSENPQTVSWITIQLASMKRPDPGVGFSLLNSRLEEMNSERPGPINILEPQVADLARIASFSGEQSALVTASSARNVTNADSMVGSTSSAATKGDGPSTAPIAPVPIALSRFLSRLERRRSLAPHDDAEGGLLEIDGNVETPSRGAALAAIVKENAVREFRDAEKIWTDLIHTLIQNRSAEASKIFADGQDEPTAESNAASDKSVETGNPEGGMIELATSDSTGSEKNIPTRQVALPVLTERSVGMDAGVAFFREFELSTSPVLKRAPSGVNDSGSDKRSFEKTDSDEPTDEPEVHPAAIPPLIFVGLMLSKAQVEDRKPSPLPIRQRHTDST
jgi:hypothetical protein